jgi:hypothetical protein
MPAKRRHERRAIAPRQARGGRPRAALRPRGGAAGVRTRNELTARIAALEERVTRLEAGKAPPWDGRAPAVKRERPVKRCPGCGLPLRRRAGRCADCGRPLDSL